MQHFGSRRKNRNSNVQNNDEKSYLPMIEPAPHTAAWYDAQYNNRSRIPEHLAILRFWSEESARARSHLDGVLDVPYGDDRTEKLDIFPTSRPRAPVLVYIHGGYWRALDKRDQSFVAAPFVDAGAIVVLPNYALCPSVTVEHIVLQMVRALAWVFRHAERYGGDPEKIVVAGHSAGGHLAAMLLSCDWRQVGTDLPEDLVKTAVAISGVFDLEPLRHAPFLAHDLKLTRQSARKLSPAAMPAPKGSLLAFVGGHESEEFIRQNALIAEAWGSTVVTVCECIPSTHHMNVLHGLACPDARLHQATLASLGLA
jgi:arylformamidase